MFSLSTARKPNAAGALSQALYVYYVSNWVNAMGPRQIHLNTKTCIGMQSSFFKFGSLSVNKVKPGQILENI